jgi:hypothetical protein
MFLGLGLAAGGQDRYGDGMIKRVAPIVAMSCALWGLAPGAGAHDHRPPRVEVRSAGERQRARPWSLTWTRASGGNTCLTTIADGVPNYRRAAMPWSPKRKIHLRLFKRHKPRRLAIRMYVRLDENGYVTGRGRPADFSLRRVWLNGKRVWIAGFFGRRTRRHLYLSVRVGYRDVEGCGGRQSMSLAYHLRRRGT